MTDLTKLGIHSLIRTAVLKFSIGDEQYPHAESEIIRLFRAYEFSNVVSLHVDPDEFLNFYLSADVEDREAFMQTVTWLLVNLEELGATLEEIEAHDD